MSVHKVQQQDRPGAYSMRPAKNGGLQITSATTGKSYPYERDQQRLSLRAAIFQMSQDDRAHRTAAAQRPVVETPAPTRTEKLDSVVHAPKARAQTADERIASFEAHVAEVKDGNYYRPGDRARAKRRTEALQKRLDRDLQSQDARLARAALAVAPETVAQIAEAQAVYDKFVVRGDVPSHIVEAARQNLDTLKTDLSVADAVERAAKIQDLYISDRAAQIQVLRERAEASQRKAERLMAEALAVVSETPAEAPATP